MITKYNIIDGVLLLPNNQQSLKKDADQIPLGTIVLCGLCRERCTEIRGKLGYKDTIDAKNNNKTTYDLWLCPYREAGWHHRAEMCAINYKQTCSKTLKEIYKKDMWYELHNRGNDES